MFIENNMKAFEELMQIRGLPAGAEKIVCTGNDPVLASRFSLGETAADIHLAIGVAVNDLWQLRTGNRQDLGIKVAHAVASLKSTQFLNVPSQEVNSAFALQRSRQAISTPHLTKDGRYFLPHMGLPHLGERVLKILGCKYELDSVVRAVAQWDALDLEQAIAAERGCGAMVRTETEWLQHPQGSNLALKPVIEIEKIADSDPEPIAEGAALRPLESMRVLDLTRILAGPTCARTLAEHGADVLMVTAQNLPQTEYFVIDTSHGKRTTFLDLNNAEQKSTLLGLVKNADVFSQGYRPGVMAKHGLSPDILAELRPGLIYTSMNCYGYEGPFADRAGWEQLAQTVTGLAAEQGGVRPRLLPAAVCDYATGYLAAYGTLLAMGMRAREGGSYHVKASLCQSAMFVQRQPRVDYQGEGLDIEPNLIAEIQLTTDTPYGEMKHLGPVLTMSETSPQWQLPSSPLGSHKPQWIG
jgi:crotonobetainyl-CoA:carnitine CoA-transferase CaiB-like acyl-CoA transferase